MRNPVPSEAPAVWITYTVPGASLARLDVKIYNVAGDTWRPIAPAEAPVGRLDAPGVWTGRAYVIWGGSDNQGEPIGDGAIYDPSTRSWAPATGVGAPAARAEHTAVWVGGIIAGCCLLAFSVALTTRPWCDGAWFADIANNLLHRRVMGMTILDPTEFPDTPLVKGIDR